MLLRERFFGDRLWVPDGTLPAPPVAAPHAIRTGAPADA